MTSTPPKTSRLPRSERREQLVAAAREVFVQQGYHAASMDQIAERAGVSKPLLYQHFPSKLSLYTALIEVACDEMIEAARSALASTTNNEERVRATVRLWYEFAAEDGPAFRLIFDSDLTSDPHIRELLERVYHDSAVGIAEFIVADTDIDFDAALLLASNLIGGGHMSARTWFSSGSRLSIDEAATLTSQLLWRGIAGFPKTV